MRLFCFSVSLWWVETNEYVTAITRSGTTTMLRFGFGDVTGENEKSGTKQYKDGHVEFSNKAMKHATQEYPQESPAGAVALRLAQVGGVDLSDHSDPTVNVTALRDAVESVDGVGEETANDVLAAIEEAL